LLYELQIRVTVNLTSLYEDVCGNRGVAPLILNVGTTWIWVVNLSESDRFTPGERTGGTKRGWEGPRAGLGVFDKR